MNRTGVMWNVMGVTGRALLEALVRGEQTDESFVTSCRRGKLKSTTGQMLEAIERRIEILVIPLRCELDLLQTIPGVKVATAHTLLAEIGPDMSRFRSSAHLLSWAGLCPGRDESAGKKRSSVLRRGPRWLKPALVQAARPAARKKHSYDRAQFHRLRARRGARKAIVAASMLTAAVHMLSRRVPFSDLGSRHFDQRERDRTAKRLIHRLGDLGRHVQVQSAAEPESRTGT